ncbi:unnamed protein product [Bursaphelenchus okinawaensis]|uniref:UBX domain-containing protein n=1 Tax=Bursaphelenchus okinawaensis TaxID=465554 RepID=A0A811KCP3_9BILA|nr:unnamed protein product [Bursaphelenchus okinawaensis]CAG9099317.1 unnamed protein product [Bursaphelenchus okinawaensis]
MLYRLFQDLGQNGKDNNEFVTGSIVSLYKNAVASGGIRSEGGILIRKKNDGGQQEKKYYNMSNIRSFGDLKGDEPDDSSGEDEGRQDCFVGGSERSGQQVLGLDRDGELADRVFKSAQHHGRETLSTEEAERFRDGASDPNSGVRLSGGPSAQMNAERVHVFFWQNGYSVDDGPLKPYSSKDFYTTLEAISFHIPQKWLDISQRDVILYIRNCHDKSFNRDTEYVKPNPKFLASSDHRLGAVVPEIVYGETSQAEPSADEDKKLIKEAQSFFGLKEGEPTGRIRIRKPNGECLAGTFNPSHLVEDVRSFIVLAAPELAFKAFRLFIADFPNMLIEDEVVTVEKAALFTHLTIIQTGDLIGTDKFGNKYFQDDGNSIPADRWVVFGEKQDVTQVPPEWHRWLHHMTDEPPTVKPVDRK